MKYFKQILVIILVIILFNIPTEYESFLLFIAGVSIVLWGLKQIYFIDDIYKNGIKRRGKIIAFETDVDGHKLPIIEYQTREGEICSGIPLFYTTTDLSIFAPTTKLLDTKVIIQYDLFNPNKFVLYNDDEESYIGIFIIITIGLVFVIVSYYVK